MTAPVAIGSALFRIQNQEIQYRVTLGILEKAASPEMRPANQYRATMAKKTGPFDTPAAHFLFGQG
jgi:hypothetical protein